MNIAGSLIIGGALAAAIVGPNFIPHYQIAAGKDTDGNPMAWRIETRTGEIEACHFSPVVGGTGEDPFAVFDPPSSLQLSCAKKLAISKR
jgi:hypothetical protein